MVSYLRTNAPPIKLSCVYLILGTLEVKYVVPPFPRSFQGRFHILFAILRQLHLVLTLLFAFLFDNAKTPDVFLVDQLSACIPLLRLGTCKRVVFYCHFPDKLLADGKAAVVKGEKGAEEADDASSSSDPVKELQMKDRIKLLYRMPVDWLEEATTGQLTSHFVSSRQALFNSSKPRPVGHHIGQLALYFKSL